MSPKLERETDIKSLGFEKFLRYKDVIIYDKCDKNHSEIAREHGFDILVDDGGWIEPVTIYTPLKTLLNLLQPQAHAISKETKRNKGK